MNQDVLSGLQIIGSLVLAAVCGFLHCYLRARDHGKGLRAALHMHIGLTDETRDAQTCRRY